MKTYFISDGTLVKIGRSVDPLRRLATFQTSSPEKLKIVLTLDGDRELDLHQRFAEFRVRGEWFRPSVEMLSFIASNGGEKLGISFWCWISSQTHRRDALGRFALIVLSDKAFPRGILHLDDVHCYYADSTPQMRGIAKIAHSVWRLSCTDDTDGSRYSSGRTVPSSLDEVMAHPMLHENTPIRKDKIHLRDDRNLTTNQLKKKKFWQARLDARRESQP